MVIRHVSRDVTRGTHHRSSSNAQKTPHNEKEKLPATALLLFTTKEVQIQPSTSPRPTPQRLQHQEPPAISKPLYFSLSGVLEVGLPDFAFAGQRKNHRPSQRSTPRVGIHIVHCATQSASAATRASLLASDLRGSASKNTSTLIEHFHLLGREDVVARLLIPPTRLVTV